jgi:hypothetical protein
LAEANDLLRGAVKVEADLMGSQLRTLTASDIHRFERDGYLCGSSSRFSPTRVESCAAD